MVKPLWQPVPMMESPCGEKVFPCNLSEALLFQFKSVVSRPVVMEHCEEATLLDNLCTDSVRLPLGLPGANKERNIFSFPGCTRAVPLVSLYIANAMASWPYQLPSVKLAPIYRCLTFTGDPKLDAVFYIPRIFPLEKIKRDFFPPWRSPLVSLLWTCLHVLTSHIQIWT